MRRYRFLTKDAVFLALNKLRAAFLAAKDGSEVDEIIKSVLTHDEQMKIGRRVQIAQMLLEGKTYLQIKSALKVGVPTITLVDRKIKEYPLGYKLINRREGRVETEYKQKAYATIGGSKMVFKRKEYTGFKRKDVQR